MGLLKIATTPVTGDVLLAEFEDEVQAVAVEADARRAAVQSRIAELEGELYQLRKLEAKLAAAATADV